MMMHYNPEAVDVWAMGVMLYLMLTGTYPFEDPNQPGQGPIVYYILLTPCVCIR